MHHRHLPPHSQRTRPPWWPENEPWPPTRAHHWHSARGRFFRRIGCLFLGFILMGIVFFALIVSVVLNAFGLTVGVQGASHVDLLAMVVLSILGLSLLAWVARGVRHLSVPFGDLLDAAGRVAEGDYSAHVRERGPREVRSLTQAFNTMISRLKSHDQQRRDLLADVTHELRTPLTVIQGNLEAMLDGVYPADEAQLKLLMEQTRLLSRLVDDLRTLALAESGSLALRREPTDLAALIRETLSGFQARALAQEVRLDFESGPGPLLEIDPERIQQVLANLVANALRYTPRGGTVSVRWELREAGDGKTCLVTVADSGPGVEADELAHIFERFHKSGDSGGMGLGLSIARSLVQAHGGTIEAESAPGQGMRMRFTLPVGES